MALFRFRRPRAAAAVPPGIRIYAVGDVHGRLDLLLDLLDRIEADSRARAPAETWIIMLGDLIDRGPDSKGVIDFFLKSQPAFAQYRFLAGNHEEAMLQSLGERADPRETGWLRFGGMEALRSYDVPDSALETRGWLLSDELRRYVPQAHLDFIASFEETIVIGDYLFVHAGIRPGVALQRQRRKDLLWIRQGFLDDETDHGHIVVHGHSITPQPVFARNRIGIDTGAYLSGMLTALGLEGGDQWVLQTVQSAEQTPS
jgi:serine/threonine protein phosphatase 1